ncbi:hypothetical protein [Deinococcus cellulosilyticus]|uniref:Uncharacterized protein n=1 Tax=Deinococcus cellulosilyticus (strain DSM 18568 / NBRC 106333 / KACC 11606 / 5516J-15) TaxID=1223518 RepID=A0A511N8A7_DEIC1|nr:hypothetical protein [Deinococcus cellulosilyticus]GEM48706.1 hypothetical protein DC3_43410 [Deinococcus cellulosilyticus NBRC 106333 = KACC 11606]
MPDPRLQAIAQILQQDPAAYRGYGWMWWAVKDLLRQHFSQEELSGLGECSNPTLLRVAERQYPQVGQRINAAIDHYTYRAQRAQLYSSDDHLPDGAPVRVLDPDFQFANL